MGKPLLRRASRGDASGFPGPLRSRGFDKLGRSQLQGVRASHCHLSLFPSCVGDHPDLISGLGGSSACNLWRARLPCQIAYSREILPSPVERFSFAIRCRLHCSTAVGTGNTDDPQDITSSATPTKQPSAGTPRRRRWVPTACGTAVPLPNQEGFG
ncbi:hypothetical protein PCANC_08560 [Puccinia coronata f. sp. avenae]|uniref:Uncharacterized protein n=1 Tax=Puccinia coronata f. sp. avenae TaxID=200324 RepID=A0A2N5S2B7_9BASI|nr:hypothetical protein PCANC_26153 [Puccinia coronata f. sp. avenae]PLW34495.1 hypothetical protein PCASD_09805 [Puccinia coronata f. sp. avenae]PLW44021.1 hypothetical protein PCANC_08560 [Puccinia coronata f. sp. avenae]